MSDLIDDFGDPDGDEPRQRLFTRIAHLKPWALAIGGPIGLASYIVPWEPFQWIALAIVAGMVLTSLIGSFHGQYGRICVRCMSEVPADAPLRAERRRYRAAMREQHRPMFGSLRRPGTMPMLGLLWGIQTGGFWLLGAHWFGVPLMAWCLWSMTAQWVHHRYKPWCPWCKWGDGGSPERVPDPDPVGEGTRS